MGVVKPARRAASQVGKPAPLTSSTDKPSGTDDPVTGMMPRCSARAAMMPIIPPAAMRVTAESTRSLLLPPATFPSAATFTSARKPRQPQPCHHCRAPAPQTTPPLSLHYAHASFTLQSHKHPAAELTARRPRRRCRDPGAARRRVHHGEWGCAPRPRGLLRSS